MFNAKKLLGQCVVAAALASSAIVALASPVSYHVRVDTQGLMGTGALDLYLASAAAGGLPLTATLSNFSSAFGTIDNTFPSDYTVLPNGSFVLTNGSGYNDLTRFITLGGALGFDVAFDGAALSTVDPRAGGLFTVGLFDAAKQVVGDPNGIVSFTFDGRTPGIIDIGFDRGLAMVFANPPEQVPEPSALLMTLTGLGIAVVMLRGRSRVSR